MHTLGLGCFQTCRYGRCAAGRFRGSGRRKVKRTYRPKLRRRHRRHGFLMRMRSKSGRRIIARRRAIGRRRLAV